MKIFLLFVGLMAKEAFCQKRITVDTRAPSTYQNCDCQCDSVTWTDGSTIKGNCRSQDKNGVLFCYISGSAIRACGDVQRSSFLPNNNGQLRYYSYNACTTPPRNQCRNNNNFGNQNWGDGDYESNGGSNTYYPPHFFLEAQTHTVLEAQTHIVLEAQTHTVLEDQAQTHIVLE